MNNQRSDQDRGFLTDMMRFGPAPTPQRELAVTILTIALFAIVLSFVDTTAGTWVVAAILVIYLAGRWVLGIRRWSKADTR